MWDNQYILPLKCPKNSKNASLLMLFFRLVYRSSDSAVQAVKEEKLRIGFITKHDIV